MEWNAGKNGEDGVERFHQIEYRKLPLDHLDGISTDKLSNGEDILHIKGDVLRETAKQGFTELAHLYRPKQLELVSNILKDPEASSNDRFVAMELLKNACASAGMVLPLCQDTGTALVVANRGHRVITDGMDERHITEGIWHTWQSRNLRYSQMAPLDMITEKNTGTNLPAGVQIWTKPGMNYKILFNAKGGGSANKTNLYQLTKAVLTEEKLMEFLTQKVTEIGTAACPPYHLCVVIGGLAVTQTLDMLRFASCRLLDGWPTTGTPQGRGFRDVEWEKKLIDMTRTMGIGAQFGGKYFLHDCRVFRLPRHGASVPIGIGLMCSADRHQRAKINKDGVFLEKFETEPAKYLPDIKPEEIAKDADFVKVDLNNPMADNLKLLSQYPIKTRLMLSGTLVVARDIAHSRMNQMLKDGKGLPDYIKKYPIYYAGPAKTPDGMPSGSFGPTTSGRMDTYVDDFQKAGGSMVMIGKGNRSKQVGAACKANGGFYLGSIGGVAAALTSQCITKIECLDMEELGMEAVWKITVKDLPAFVVIDDKGNDFYKKYQPQ
jgi:fumarate hydratase class I